MLLEEKVETAEKTVSIQAPTANENPDKQLFNKRMILKGAMWLGLLTIASVAVVFFIHILVIPS